MNFPILFTYTHIGRSVLHYYGQGARFELPLRFLIGHLLIKLRFKEERIFKLNAINVKGSALLWVGGPVNLVVPFPPTQFAPTTQTPAVNDATPDWAFDD